MQCREHCGACCIAPSISSPIPDMPKGKPAGIACVHLSEDYSCNIFNLPQRPKVCAEFQAELGICGHNQAQALSNLIELENLTVD